MEWILSHPVLTSPVFLAAMSLVATAVALSYSAASAAGSGRSRLWLAFATFPGLIGLSAFYSLAVHMRVRLGGWPDGYGLDGLPVELQRHTDLAQWLYGAMLLAALGMPALVAACAVVPRLRDRMIYPAFCGAACWGCFFLTELAPDGFRDWWWD